MSQAGHRAYISRTMYSESLLKDRYRPAPYGIFFEIRSNAADKHLCINSYMECVCRLTTTRQMLYTFAMINTGDDLGLGVTA